MLLYWILIVIGTIAFVLDLYHNYQRWTRLANLLLGLNQGRISFTSHRYLEPAPQVITLSEPFTVEKVMKHVRQELLLQDCWQVIEDTLRGIENLHQWNEIFIHDLAVNILHLRTDDGNNTICIRI